MAELTYRARGLVLRRTKLKECDLIIDVLTDGTRQVRAVAHGARKPGARLAGALGLGNEVELMLRHGKGLDTVSEATLVRSREACACQLERASMMDVVLEVADLLTAEGEHGPALLPLTATALEALEPASDGRAAQRVAVAGESQGSAGASLGEAQADSAEARRISLLPMLGAAYVLKAVSMQGYRPQLDACMLCGEPQALEGAGSAWLAPAEGGVVCQNCAASVRTTRWPMPALAWARSLITMRFSQILALPPAPGEAAVGLDVLGLCREWLSYYPGAHPRSLDFVLSLGTYS